MRPHPAHVAPPAAGPVRRLPTAAPPAAAPAAMPTNGSAGARLAMPARTAPAARLGVPDWDLLFVAVTQRLEHAADLTRQDAALAQAQVIDCAQALARLHTLLQQERAAHAQREMQLFDTRAALARTSAQLSSSQAIGARVRHLALHDSLTGLPNRRHLQQRLAQALAVDGARLSLLYLDLDGFKQINDTHGHACGDELLRVMAARLVRAVRADDVVGRLGGDEFACLVHGMPSRDQLAQLARKLIDVVSAPCHLAGRQVRVRPSIGIARGPQDGRSADTLLAGADAAMYRAKRHGLGHAFCSASPG